MTNKALTVSIVIPAYNEEHQIEPCLQAIAAQTVQPSEVFVVDNNSTDHTVAIVKRYKFAQVISESQQGIVYARNTGFNAVNSDIIARIDADTILPPNWVRRVQDFYAEPSHKNFALTGGCYFYNIRLPHFYGWMQGQIAFRLNRLLMGHYITFGTNMALPKKLWDKTKIQMCTRTDIHEDVDVAIHLHRAGYQITYDETLKVGMKMRRVRSHQDQLWKNLVMWPQTLRSHGLWTWIFGWLGAVLLYCMFPLGPAMESIARLFGKQPIEE